MRPGLCVGIPWLSSGQDSVLSTPASWVRELRSRKLRGTAKKQNCYTFEGVL